MAGFIWTQQDYDAVKAAIIALASGESVQSVTFAGPPQRTVVYQQMDLDKLRSLFAEIARDLGAGGAQTYRRVRFQKGFRDGEEE